MPETVTDPQIRGLIFDCDGTLADTMPLHFVAWQATLSRYNVPLDEDRFYSLAGQPTVHPDVAVANLDRLARQSHHALDADLSDVLGMAERDQLPPTRWHFILITCIAPPTPHHQLMCEKCLQPERQAERLAIAPDLHSQCESD